MPPTDPAEIPQASPKSWVLRLSLLFLLLIIAIIALFTVWRMRLSNHIQKTLAEIHAAGFPTNLLQLEQQYYPNIPTDENSAPFFKNAFNLVHTPNNEKVLPDYQSAKSAAFFATTNVAKITQLLASNRDGLEILRQSPPATNCRYPINLRFGMNTLLPHLNPLRESSHLLALDAVVWTRNGDLPGAIDDLNAMFRLCHSLDNEPFLICQLMRENMETLVVTCLGYVLNSAQLTDAQLVQLSQAFREVGRSTGMGRAMAADLCAGIDAFQTGFGSASTAYNLFRMTGLPDRDLDFYVQTMSENLRLTSTPFPEKLDAARTIDLHTAQTTSNHIYSFSTLLLTSSTSASVKEGTTIARLNIIQTVLAIERYRLANQNRLPEKPSELVPSFLPAELMDPFDGKPLRYKKLAKGYMVYSIGKDQRDDGGVFAEDLKPGPADITFVVER